VGLLGRNGAGKSTLFDVACGLVLPTEGSCRTLGVDSGRLGDEQLARLGVVHQNGTFPAGITVRRLLDFTASFYGNWDRERERRLSAELELPLDQKVNGLSPGDQQKAALVAAVCHHPSLVLLDEPVSALDPVVRARTLRFLLSLIREDASTIVIASHILADLEKVVDWLACLDRGNLSVSASLDDIQERYAVDFGRPLSLDELFPHLTSGTGAET
jgi:ABC-2 type transport system ATP-binding protein